MSPLKKFWSKLHIDSVTWSRILLVLLVLLLVAATIWISGPLPQRDSEGMIITPQAQPTTISLLTDNHYRAPDILETTPTSGVVLGAFGVVLIILLGTFIAERNQK